MQSQETIKAVLENRPKEGWYVYRYKIGWGILGLFFRLFYVGLFGGMVEYMAISALPALIALLMTLSQIYTLLYAKTNMVILTDDKAVKSWRGKIQEYPYSQIANLKMTRIFGGGLLPRQYIEFNDKGGSVVELARGRQFGLAQNIFSVLQSKTWKTHQS